MKRFLLEDLLSASCGWLFSEHDGRYIDCCYGPLSSTGVHLSQMGLPDLPGGNRQVGLDGESHHPCDCVGVVVGGVGGGGCFRPYAKNNPAKVIMRAGESEARGRAGLTGWKFGERAAPSNAHTLCRIV